MKQFLTTLAIAGILAVAPAWADDAAASNTESGSNASAVASLCSTYAEEDGIAAAKKDAYIQECLKNMTDLSEGVQETVPLVADTTEEPLAAPTSEKVNSDPEQLVKSELVEIPDPTAEQLDADKK
jgi:hypothetical protein